MEKFTIRTTLFTVLTILIAIVFFDGCKHYVSNEDLKKVNSWNKLFSAGKPKLKALDQPVCRTMSVACMLAYKNLYSDPTTNSAAILKSYTETVGFGGKNLGNWIDDIIANTDVDSIKVCFGVYTQKMLDQFPQQLDAKKLGRLTVFLKAVAADKKNAVYIRNSTYISGLTDGCTAARTQPYAQGDTTDNYNLGSLYP